MANEKVENGKAVLFTYSVVDEEGNVLEQSDLPIGYVHGADSGILPKLAEGMAGHTVGDTVSILVTPEEGFGPHDPDLTFTDDIENVPEQFRHVGAQVQFQNEAGEVKEFVVTKIEDGKLTVDGNHPFAGKNVTFKVTIREIRDATPEEMRAGRPGESAPVLH